MVMHMGILEVSVNRSICDNGDVAWFVCTAVISCLIALFTLTKSSTKSL